MKRKATPPTTPIKIRSVQTVPRTVVRFVIGEFVVEGNITREQAEMIAAAVGPLLKPRL